MDNNKKFGLPQFVKNVMSNGGLFLINTIISFWFTPYLIHSVGEELYGFVPLVASVINYFTLITFSINASTGRYLMIELEKEDWEKSNQIFNTSLVGLIIIVLITIPIGALLITFVSSIFQVPEQSLGDIRFLVMSSVIAFILTAVSSGFSIASYSQNRFDLQNIISFAGRMGQVLVVVILFRITQPSLIPVGLGLIFLSSMNLIGNFFLFKNLIPQVRIRLRMFNKKILKDMLNTNFWMLINRIGTLFFLNLEIILANQNFSLLMAGMYGALLTIPNNLRTIANTVTSVWGPKIISNYGQKNYEGMDFAAKSSIKIIGIVIALPIGYIIGVSGEFISLWLGPDFWDWRWVAVLMAFNVMINSLTSPLESIFHSFNKVAVPALVTSVTSIIYYFFSIFLLERYGPEGLAISGGIILALRNVLFVPVYAAKLLNQKWWRYITGIIPIPVVTVLVAFITNQLGSYLHADTYFLLIVVGGIVSLVYVVGTYFIALTKAEKNALYQTFIKGRLTSFLR